jgi:acetyl esterase/lipase
MQRHDPINLPQTLPLWPDDRKPRASAEDLDFPTFTYYLPSDEFRTGQSVLILPGGGYHLVSSAKEGHRPAQWLCARGIATAVLEYRHAPSRYPVPLLDAQRALRLLRRLASDHNLNPARVGVMGFSAGGHLAGLLATQPPHDESNAGDEHDNVSPQPDFCAMIYGVVMLLGKDANEGSPRGLLGDPPPADLARQLSIENAVQAGAPPFFVAHGRNDTTVPVRNATLLFDACHAVDVPVTLHIYEDFAHGIGMADNHPWTRDLLEWLQSPELTG